MDTDPDRLARQAESDGIDKLVVGAIIHDHGRALILRRSAHDDFLPGIEELPSGGVEHGEDLRQALARELDEETGPRRLGPALRYVDSFDYLTGSGRRARQFTFSLPYDGAPIHLSPEHTAHRWITPADFDHTDLTEESRRTLRTWAAQQRSATTPST
jgi:8-oxo-dGTP diphosphatase